VSVLSAAGAVIVFAVAETAIQSKVDGQRAVEQRHLEEERAEQVQKQINEAVAKAEYRRTEEKLASDRLLGKTKAGTAVQFYDYFVQEKPEHPEHAVQLLRSGIAQLRGISDAEAAAIHPELPDRLKLGLAAWEELAKWVDKQVAASKDNLPDPHAVAELMKESREFARWLSKPQARPGHR
jgi:hypothetical protein